jgi:hypothetical protein
MGARARVLIAVSCLAVMLGSPSDAAAHEPTSHWTCFQGGGGFDGRCWFHWPNATRTWHFLGEVPSGPRGPIHNGSHTITDGHALEAVEDGAAPNHVHWDTRCGVACVVGYETGTGQHILGFQIHFDSSRSWNTNTSLGHGDFTRLDLWMVAAHEWGHTVGLGHSTRAFGHDCTGRNNVNTDWATMTQGDCLIGGHTEQRSLQEADRTGRCQVYSHAHEYAC